MAQNNRNTEDAFCASASVAFTTDFHSLRLYLLSSATPGSPDGYRDGRVPQRHQLLLAILAQLVEQLFRK